MCYKTKHVSGPLEPSRAANHGHPVSPGTGHGRRRALGAHRRTRLLHRPRAIARARGERSRPARGRATSLRVFAVAVASGGQSLRTQACARHVFPGIARASRRSAARQGWFGRVTRRARSHRRTGRARRARKQTSMIKGTIILLVARAVIPLLKRRSAAERHALWAAAIAVAALLPLLASLLPSWAP